MTNAAFVNSALYSIDIYKSYIEKKKRTNPLIGKSVSTVIRKMKDGNGNFFLTLDKRIFSIDCIELMIAGVSSLNHWKDELRFIKWDDRNRLLTIHVSDNLAQFIDSKDLADIQICSDMMFLVRRLEEWYKNHTYSFRIACPACASELSPPSSSDFIEPPSAEQEKALSAIFEYPLTYIWGAPGTGKTKFVLSYALLNYLKAGKKVIVTAPTNNAVDQTLLGVMRVLEENGVSTRSVLRLGVPGWEIAEKYPYICENRLDVKYLEECKRDYDIIQNILKVRSFNSDMSDVIAYVEEYTRERHSDYEYLEKLKQQERQLISDVSYYEDELKKITSDMEHQHQDISLKQSKKDRLLQERRKAADSLKEISSRSTLFRFFAKSQIQAAENQISALDKTLEKEDALLSSMLSDYEKTFKKKSNAENQIPALKKKCRTIHVQRNNLASQLSRELQSMWDKYPILKDVCATTHPSPTVQNIEEIYRHLNKVKPKQEEATKYFGFPVDELKETLFELKETIDELEQIETNRFENTSIIAATTDTIVGRYNLLNEHRNEISHVFMDEAAYSPIIKAMICYSFDCPVTFLGDHMQLPPVCEMKSENLSDFEKPFATLWMQSAIHSGDVFEEEIKVIYKKHADRLLDIPKNTVCRSLNYTYRFSEKIAGILSQNVYSSDFRGNNNGETNIIVLDAKKGHTEGRKNIYEAKTIQQYLSSMQHNNYAILTPYKEQVELLKRILHNVEHHCIMTVHASQGREWDTVFLSVSDTQNMFFTDSTNRDTDGLRIINTAVSRAKHELIIVCDYEFWVEKSNQIICKFIKNTKEIYHNG